MICDLISFNLIYVSASALVSLLSVDDLSSINFLHQSFQSVEGIIIGGRVCSGDDNEVNYLFDFVCSCDSRVLQEIRKAGIFLHGRHECK